MAETVRLIAAPHTPFDSRGDLRLEIVEKQVEHLLRHRVHGAFIGGSTGECQSLTLTERRQLTQRWVDVARGTSLKIIVHVGSNCLVDARELATQAEQCGVEAISAHAPAYFRPSGVDALVDCCAEVASAAPNTPFYFYDIPPLTHVHLSMPEFLARAGDRIPNLAGLKYSNPDLVAFQQCRHTADGRYRLFWGIDEMLLAALALGANGAVGSTYNFGAPIYHQLIAAFEQGNLAVAREQQFRSVRLVSTLAKRGFMGSAKAMMAMLGVDVGPPRLPHARLTTEQVGELRRELESASFLD